MNGDACDTAFWWDGTSDREECGLTEGQLIGTYLTQLLRWGVLVCLRELSLSWHRKTHYAVELQFADAFAKLRKVTVSSDMSGFISPSALVHGTTRLPLDGLSWPYIWVFFKNLSRKFRFHWNRTRIAATLHEDRYIFLSYLAQYFLEW